MAGLGVLWLCALAASPVLLAADDFGPEPAAPHAFREDVEAALEQLKRILDEERSPQYPADVSHTYEDKYLLSELTTRAAAASLVQVFGLLDGTWPGFSGKPLPSWATGAPLLIFSFCQFCELMETSVQEIQVAPTKIEETESLLGSWKSVVKAKTQVEEHLWNWTTTWNIYVTAEGASESIPLLSGTQGKTLKTMTTPPAQPQRPRPAADCAPTLELDVTWLSQRLRGGEVDFAVNRSAADCHTPARNRDTQAALTFFQKTHAFAERAANTLLAHLGSFAKMDGEDPRKPGPGGRVFQPVLALFALDSSRDTEASQPVLSADLETVLAAYRRSLRQSLQTERWSGMPEDASEYVDPSLVRALIVAQEMESLAIQMTSVIRALERMLRDQLSAALGKQLQPDDFGEYMDFHSRELLRPNFQPSPFVFAVRRAQHHPEGTVSIEGTGRQGASKAISTFRWHREGAAAMRMELSSAATVSLTGEHFLHAAVFHRFAQQPAQNLRLLARARQLSCYVLLVGKIIASDMFRPAAALIIQNKDDLVIPLLSETVPSPKEFLDSIQSLSPEQQRFARAFRKMQISSSLFAVAVVQIKPALERVLNLPEHSLTKEIQLTQDLIELFVRYQVAPDLMSFEPWTSGLLDKVGRVSTGEKVAAVKNHVKALWETINASKQKQLEEKQAEMKMRNMQNCGVEDCSTGDRFSSVQSDPAVQELRGARMAKRKREVPHVQYATLSMESMQQPRTLSAKIAAGDLSSGPQEATSPAPPPPASSQTPRPTTRAAPPGNAEDEAAGAMDYTRLPHQLDANYLQFDTDAVLRPTNVEVGSVWIKQEMPGLLGEVQRRELRAAEQREETNKAFDLLDALSRSGAEALESTLHILVAATHCFDETVLNSVVQQNRNPIEKMERSMLIMASTIHQTPVEKLVHPHEVDRLRTLSPGIFSGLSEPKTKSKLM